MLRKLTALILAVALCIVGISTEAFAATATPMPQAETAIPQTQTETPAGITFIETSKKVITTQEVDGSTLACEYEKDTEKYFLLYRKNRRF